MTKPKYKVGDSIVVRTSETECVLTKITRGYLNDKENKWNYWTEESCGMNKFGYVKEEDIIRF